jgi:hypothetical protein
MSIARFCDSAAANASEVAPKGLVKPARDAKLA